jgi:hypothetical protein
MDPDAPRIVRDVLPLAELRELADRGFGDMVKASVDIGRGVLAIGGELHSDEEALLIEDGAAQSDIWGINIYPDEPGDAWNEFDAMINVRPGQGNRSRSVADPATQSRVRKVVEALIRR